MFNIQRPATWLFNALGIVSGGAPLQMWNELTAQVDVVQGGLGLADRPVMGFAVNGVGVGIAKSILPNEDVRSGKYAWLFRCGFTNGDSAGVLLGAYYASVTGPGMFNIVQAGTTAGQERTWADLGFPGQYCYVPPLCHLHLVGDGATTGASQIAWEYIRVPAGTKPW